MVMVVSHWELATGKDWPRLMWYVQPDPVVHEAVVKWQSLADHEHPGLLSQVPSQWLHVTVLSSLPQDADPEQVLQSASGFISDLGRFSVNPQPAWWPESLVAQLSHPTWIELQYRLAKAADVPIPQSFRPHMTLGYSAGSADVNLPDGPTMPRWTVSEVSLVEVTQRADLGWYEWRPIGQVCLR
jgi:2'-5' RNA ligase